MDNRPLCRPSWREIVLLRRALQLWKCRCQRSHFGRMGVDGWLGVPSLESNAAMGNHGFERDNHRTSLMMYDDLICFCLYLCGYVWYQRVYCWTYLGIILSNLKWPHSQRLPETVIFNDYFFLLGRFKPWLSKDIPGPCLIFEPSFLQYGACYTNCWRMGRFRFSSVFGTWVSKLLCVWTW